MARGVNVQPAIAQRRSLRTTNQGNILEQATKLKAQKNGLTGKSQFTAFTSQSSDKLSKVAKICKINLGNEIEAHLAIDRLKAHEAAKAAILEAKQKV
jgi:tRNA U38,U39,U40 pseudouridine synthase TruA